MLSLKGTQAEGASVFLTPNEVALAMEQSVAMELFIVHSIEITEMPDGPVPISHEQRVIEHWKTEAHRLHQRDSSSRCLMSRIQNRRLITPYPPTGQRILEIRTPWRVGSIE